MTNINDWLRTNPVGAEQEDDEDETPTLESTVLNAPDLSPDDAAARRRVAQQAGVSPVLGDNPLTQRAADARRLRDLQTTNPRLAAWMTQPDNYAVARDDADNLSIFERLAQDVTTGNIYRRLPGASGDIAAATTVGFNPLGAGAYISTRHAQSHNDAFGGEQGRQGRLDVEHSALAYRAQQEARGLDVLSPEDRARLDELATREGQEDWGPFILGPTRRLLPQLVGGFQRSDQEAVRRFDEAWENPMPWTIEMRPGPTGHGLVPHITPTERITAGRVLQGGVAGALQIVPTAIATFGGGAGGYLSFGYEMETGIAFDQMVRAGIDPQIAAVRAEQYGATATAIEFASDALGLKISGIPRLLTRGVLGEQILTRGVGSAALRVGQATVGLGLEQGGEEALQEYAQIIHQDLAQQDQAGDGEPIVRWTEVLTPDHIHQILTAGYIGFQGGIGMGAIPGGANFTLDVMAVRQAEAGAQRFEQWTQAAQASRLNERGLTATMESAIGAMDESNVYIDADRFVEHFQSAGVNAYAVADELGISESTLATALASHGQVEIPTSTFSARVLRIPQHASLAEHARITPDADTPAEARMAGERIQAAIEQIVEETKGLQADNDIGQVVETRVRELFTQAQSEGGPRPEVAARYARLVAALPRAVLARARQSNPEYATRLEEQFRRLFGEELDIAGPDRDLGAARQTDQEREQSGRKPSHDVTRVLSLIYNEGLNARQAAKRLGLDHSSVVALLKRMVARGEISPLPDYAMAKARLRGINRNSAYNEADLINAALERNEEGLLLSLERLAAELDESGGERAAYKARSQLARLYEEIANANTPEARQRLLTRLNVSPEVLEQFEAISGEQRARAPSLAREALRLAKKDPSNIRQALIEYAKKHEIEYSPAVLNATISNARARARLELSRETEGETQNNLNVQRNGTSGERFQFAGERASGYDEEKLARAEEMEEVGYTPNEIWRETGWWRNKADKKWRYEINDENVEFINATALATRGTDDGSLIDVLRFPELFAAYPQLADLEVGITVDPSFDGPGGAYDSEANVITADGPDLPSAMSALLHEVQHAIQTIEGFANGGSVKGAREYVFEYMDAMESVRKEMVDQWFEGDRQAYEVNEANKPELYWKVENGIQEEAAIRVYMRLAGEIEARNVQRRRGEHLQGTSKITGEARVEPSSRLTAEERKTTDPSQTVDLPLNQAILPFDFQDGARLVAIRSVAREAGSEIGSTLGKPPRASRKARGEGQAVRGERPTAASEANAPTPGRTLNELAAELAQQGEDTAQGAIRAYNEAEYPEGYQPWGFRAFKAGEFGDALIRLMESANLSTFLHEFGHLTHFVLESMATDPAAPQEIKDMFQSTLDWWGVSAEQWSQMDAQARSPYYEIYARTFEAYLMEGKAPALALRSLFATLKEWLKSVYRMMRLDARLTPEIRDVFDRLLATDAELAEARAHMGADFKLAREAFKTEEEYLAVEQAIRDANEAQEAEIRARAFDAHVRKGKRWFRGERERMRDSATRAVDSDPARRAEQWLGFESWRALPSTELSDEGEIGYVASPNALEDMPDGLPPMQLDPQAIAQDWPDAQLPTAIQPRTDVESVLAEAMKLKAQTKGRGAFRSQRLARFIKDNGGLNLSTLSEEQRAPFQGVARRRPGLINNVSGKTPEEMMRLATEAGYFGQAAAREVERYQDITGPDAGPVQGENGANRIVGYRAENAGREDHGVEWWSGSPATAEQYTYGGIEGSTMRRQELAPQNPLVLDLGGRHIDSLRPDEIPHATIRQAIERQFGSGRSHGDAIVEEARKAGYDAVIFRNARDPALSNRGAPDTIVAMIARTAPDGGSARGEFNVDEPLYRGKGNNVGQRPGEDAYWLTPDRETALQFGSEIKSVYARGRLDVFDAAGRSYEEIDIPQILEAARSQGFAGVRFRNMLDEAIHDTSNAPYPDYVALFDKADTRPVGSAPNAGTTLPGFEHFQDGNDSATPESMRLTALHNLTPENLINAAKLGGLPVPSIGVVPEGIGLEDIGGSITLIGRRNLADPAMEPVYDADVWSPTFPRAEYNKVSSKKITAAPIYQAFNRWDEVYGQRFRGSANSLWDNSVNEGKPDDAIYQSSREAGAMAAYLESLGETPAPPVIRDIKAGNLTPWAHEQAWTDFVRDNPDMPYFRDATEEETAAYSAKASAAAMAAIKQMANSDTRHGDATPEERRIMADHLIEALTERAFSDGRLVLSYLDRAFDSAKMAGKTEIDNYASRDALQEQIGARGEEYREWLEREIRPLFSEPFLRMGRKKAAFTLDNIVEIMSGRVKAQQDHMTFGDGKARAAGARRFRDLEQMRRAAGTQIRSRAEAEAAQEETKKLAEQWRNSLTRYYRYVRESSGRNEFGATWESFDAAMRALSKVMGGAKTEANMARALRAEEFLDVPAHIIDEGIDLAKAFLATPVPYFEAKPQRAVALNEFAGAVIPSTAPQQVRDILTEAGVPFREYDNKERSDQATAAAAYASELGQAFRAGGQQDPDREILFQTPSESDRAPTVEEFLTTLISDLNNERQVYSSKEGGALASAQALADAQAWFDAHDIDLSKGKDEIRDQIAAAIEADRASENQWAPDDVAPWFGFSSGDELIQALSKLKPRAVAIEEQIDRLVEEEHGDAGSKARIEATARDAAHAEAQANRIEMELAALEKATGGRRKPVGAAAKAYAENEIQSMTLREVRNADVFLAGERRAARAAFEAASKKDWPAAARAKQKQLISFWLFKYARDAAENVTKIEARWKRYSTSSTTRAAIGARHIEQIDAILDTIETGKPQSQPSQTLSEWADDLAKNEDAGDLIVFNPEAVEQQIKRSLSQMSYAEVQSLNDVLRNIETIGRGMIKLRNAREAERIADVQTELKERIRTEWKDQLSRRVSLVAPSAAEKGKVELQHIDAQLLKLDYLARLLDGLKDGGPWMRLMAQTQDAENDLHARSQQATAEFLALVREHYTPQQFREMLSKRIYIDAIEDNRTKAQIISAALNVGNAYNRDALIRGERWSEQQLQDVLGKLSENDWTFVQALWNYVAQWKEESFALDERTRGSRPPEVIATPFTLPSGRTLSGGYWPVSFSIERSDKAAAREARNTIIGEYGGGFRQAATNRGRLKARAGTGGQALSDDFMGVLARHVQDSLRDITHRELVIMLRRVKADPELRNMIARIRGRDAVRALDEWVHRLAARTPQNVFGDYGRLPAYLRRAGTSHAMGFKVSVATLNLLGHLQAIPRNGIIAQMKQAGLSIAVGFPDLLRRHLQAIGQGKPEVSARVALVYEKSEMMRHRRNTFDRDINEVKGDLVGRREGAVLPKQVEDTLQILNAYTDQVVSVPTWLAAYESAKNGAVKGIDGEQASVEYADSVVRMTLSAGGAKDMAALIASNNQWQRLMTMFMGWASAFYNQLFTEQFPGVISGKISLPKFAANMIWIWLLPAVITTIFYGQHERRDDEDEWQYWTRMILTGVIYPLQTIPLVRDLMSALVQGYRPQTPVSAVIDRSQKLASAIERGDERQMIKQGFLLGGQLTGVPSQFYTSGDYAADLAMGNEDPMSDPVDAMQEAFLRDTR